ETADDAGVYQISEQMALVQTVDFITPIVDDPYLFGQIAAANSMSDVYAMGGKPLTALNVVGFPRLSLNLSVLTEILRGGLDKIHEAGAVLLGGHTVDDAELKYGLAVTGTVHPKKIVTNKGAEQGDVLLLTKSLGTGIISTANKAEMADAQFLQGAIDSMVRLNDIAAEAMNEWRPHACTDITGFGLLGHAAEMAKGCGLSFRFFYSELPLLAGAQEYATKGMVPGGAYCNQDHFGQEIFISAKVPEAERIILFDPQTSGGLLMALPRSPGEKLLKNLQAQGIQEASIIGEVIQRENNLIFVVE
ncbi:MAG: selenide, water dikinase SelD, partial [Deltaproteobacteria bacterium]|nr:selenide, water dikinase SelD [Deltaproteobacteria bacterium]